MTSTEKAAVRSNLEHLVVERYDSQVQAAAAWGMTQSTLSKILSGGRSAGSWLDGIASKEGLTVAWLRTPRLRSEPRATGNGRFQFSADDPVRMVLALEEYFADLPEGKAPQVVKAVMRTLLDHYFGAVHRPGEAWRFVMNGLEGFTGDQRKPPRSKGEGA